MQSNKSYNKNYSGWLLIQYTIYPSSTILKKSLKKYSCTEHFTYFKLNSQLPYSYVDIYHH